MQKSFVPTDVVKTAFCKDVGVSVSVLDEPYFKDRLSLYGGDILQRYIGLCRAIEETVVPIEYTDDELDDLCGLGCKEELRVLRGMRASIDAACERYMQYRGNVLKKVVDYLNNNSSLRMLRSEMYKKYSCEDMYSAYSRAPKNLYVPKNAGLICLSLDIHHANFSCVNAACPSIFVNCSSWESFLSKFTNDRSLVGSKYFRKVVFGKVLSSLANSLERGAIEQAYKSLTAYFNVVDRAAFSDFGKYILAVNKDEIVVNLLTLEQDSGMSREDIVSIFSKWVECYISESDIPFILTMFKLEKLVGVEGYVKLDMSGNFMAQKKVSNIDMPFVLRAVRREKVTENDSVFKESNSGRLARLIEVPEVFIPFK